MNEGRDMSEYPSTVELRRWAQTKKAGAGVSDLGNIPRYVIVGWNRTHPGRPFVRTESHHGSGAGYNALGCRCDQCRAWSKANYEEMRSQRDHELADQLLADEPQ